MLFFSRQSLRSLKILTSLLRKAQPTRSLITSNLLAWALVWLGVTATVLILGFVMVYIKLKRIHDRLQQIQNNSVAETRDLSLRLRKLEDK